MVEEFAAPGVLVEFVAFGELEAPGAPGEELAPDPFGELIGEFDERLNTVPRSTGAPETVAKEAIARSATAATATVAHRKLEGVPRGDLRGMARNHHALAVPGI